MNIDFIGGFSALVEKGIARGDKALIDALPRALARTQRVCASVNVATLRAGINMNVPNSCLPDKFITYGGQIPAPIHSLKN